MLRALLLPLVLAACSADHHAERGQKALDAHELEEAERRYRKALELDPVHLEALEGLGWTYSLAGQRDVARSTFARCVELDEHNTACIRGLANVALAEGDQPKARRYLSQALGLAPEDPDVIASQAAFDLLTGDVDMAAERYETLRARYPERGGEWVVGLAEARLRQGRHEEALPLIEEALADPGLQARRRAMLYVQHARALVSSTSGREDPERCEETVPPLFAWLALAEEDLDAAEATGVEVPDLGAVRRLVLRRRGVIEDACPGIGK